MGFAACWVSSLALIVPIKRMEMPTCPHTGITIPECSCAACVEAQIRRHQPALLAMEARAEHAKILRRLRHPLRRAA